MDETTTWGEWWYGKSQSEEQHLQDILRTHLFRYLKKHNIGVKMKNKFTWKFYSFKKNEIFIMSAVPTLDLQTKGISGNKFYVKELFEPNRNSVKGFISWLETMGVDATVNKHKDKFIINNPKGDTDLSVSIVEHKTEEGNVPQFVFGAEIREKEPMGELVENIPKKKKKSKRCISDSIGEDIVELENNSK